MWSRLCLVHMSMPEVLLSIRQNRHTRCTLVLGGLGGLPPAGSGRAGKRSAARPPRLAGLVSVSTSCTNLCAGYDFVCLLLTKVPF